MRRPLAARLPVLAALALAAALAVPLAFAWACGPQAGLYPDQSSYAPGESGTISGVNFTPGLSFTIDVAETGESLAAVTIPDSGGFTVAFSAPTTARVYTIVASGTDAQGNLLRSSPSTFTVAAAQPAPAQQPAGAAAPATAPAQSAPAAPAPAGARTPAARDRQPANRPATSTPLRNTNRQPARPAVAAVSPATVPAPSGAGSVFAGSVPPAVTAPTAARKSTATSARPRADPAAAPRPSESTAQASPWGGLGTGSAPALVPSGSYPATASPTSTAKTLSVLLLSLGLAALAGGVGISEVRRRRSVGG